MAALLLAELVEADHLGGALRRVFCRIVGLVIVAFSQLRGGVIGFRRGGIQWRDTFYSSAQLRAGARVQFP